MNLRKRKIVKFKDESTRSPSLENSLWRGLYYTYRRRERERDAIDTRTSTEVCLFLAHSHSRAKCILASSICPSVRLSACINATPTGRISVTFDIGHFYKNLSRRPKFG